MPFYGPALRMCLRAPEGSKGSSEHHRGLRAYGGHGPHGGPPYATPILRAGPSMAAVASILSLSYVPLSQLPLNLTIVESCVAELAQVLAEAPRKFREYQSEAHFLNARFWLLKLLSLSLPYVRHALSY
jgi:hypothetical protein